MFITVTSLFSILTSHCIHIYISYISNLFLTPPWLQIWGVLGQEVVVWETLWSGGVWGADSGYEDRHWLFQLSWRRELHHWNASQVADYWPLFIAQVWDFARLRNCEALMSRVLLFVCSSIIFCPRNFCPCLQTPRHRATPKLGHSDLLSLIYEPKLFPL